MKSVERKNRIAEIGSVADLVFVDTGYRLSDNARRN